MNATPIPELNLSDQSMNDLGNAIGGVGPINIGFLGGSGGGTSSLLPWAIAGVAVLLLLRG